MALERLLNDAALDAFPASVDQTHFTQACLMGGVHVLLDHRFDVARGEGVQIERGLNRDPVGHPVYRDAWAASLWDG